MEELQNKKDVNYYIFNVGKENWKPDLKTLEWNVFAESLNRREIEVYNIFDHYSFYNELYKIKIKFKDDFESFSKAVKSNLMYYFWSKSEWEIILTSWPPFITVEELDRLNEELKRKKEQNSPSVGWFNINLNVGIKIDVYSQIMLNWNSFINYLWDNKKLIKKIK